MILEVNPVFNIIKIPFGLLGQRVFCFVKYFALALIVGACSNSDEIPSVEEFKMELAGNAQGTTYSIVYYDLQQRDFRPQVDSILERVDQSISTYLKGSIVDKWNSSDSGGLIDSLFYDVLALSWRVYNLSNGAFDPTIKPLVNYWGFGSEKYQHPELVDQIRIDSLIKLVNLDTLRVSLNGYERSLEYIIENNREVEFPIFLSKPDSKIQLDFNAIGQGWSVDVVSKYFESKGIKKYFVEIGGELKAGYPKPDGSLWRFGIDKPIEDLNQRELEAILSIRNKGLATSGSYRKFYEKEGVKYSHTIDPRTGFPVKHNLLSATVVSDDAGSADAMATVFMVIGVDSTLKHLQEKNYFDNQVFLIYAQDEGYKTWTSPKLEKMIEAL